MTGQRLIVIILWVLVLVFILQDTYKLKTISYDKIPAVGAAADEYFYPWLGKSLTLTGMPVSWTTNLDSYKNGEVRGHLTGFSLSVDNWTPTFSNARSFPKPVVAVVSFDYGKGPSYLSLVQPNFDHPPLGGIIYSLGIPGSVTNLLDVTSEQFRYPLRYLSLITALILFVLGMVWYSPLVGLVASTVYSVFPSSVFASRITVAENILTPLILLSILFLSWGKRKSNNWTLFLAGGLFAGLAVVTKFTGVGVVFAGIVLMRYWKIRWNHVLIYTAPAAVLIVFYILYGLFLSSDLFFKVILAQAGRAGWGSMGLINNFGKIAFEGFPLDGWWAGGPLVLLYLASNKRHVPLMIIGITYLITVLFFGGGIYAWYFFPFCALFSLGYGVLISETLRAPSRVGVLILVLFPFLGSIYWGVSQLSPNADFTWPFRLLIFLLVGGLWIIPKFAKPDIRWRYLWTLAWGVILMRLYVITYRSDLFFLTQWNNLNPSLFFK